MTWWEILTLIYIGMHLIFGLSGIALVTEDPCHDHTFPFLSPLNIYEKTKLNWLGVICIYIIYFAAVPLFAILKFTWWAFHVGRN